MDTAYDERPVSDEDKTFENRSSLLLESNRKHEILQTKALITVSALQGR